MLICAVVVCIHVHVKNDQIDLISAVNHYDVIILHCKPAADPRWNKTGIWGTTAGPRRISGGIRVSRGGIESGQVRGSAGGLRKIVRGGERAGEKNPGLYCSYKEVVPILADHTG